MWGPPPPTLPPPTHTGKQARPRFLELVVSGVLPVEEPEGLLMHAQAPWP